MTAKKEMKDRYWKAKQEDALKVKYAQYQKESALEANPHNAHRFAIHLKKTGAHGSDKSERDIILTVQSDGPQHFD